ncbi:MAG: histidinol dehydrogenase [Myxococcota bacterium]|nr:histidinol dehydrogenase [Myxococcota bacterium]
MSKTPLLEIITTRDLPSLRREPVDAKTLAAAAAIVERVREEGDAELRVFAEQFGDIEAGAPMILERAALDAALERIASEDREMLERTADRIREFANAQRASLTDMTMQIPGGEAGHTVAPVDVAGCYAPGGRFPLPSSVLMTAITARAAGCPDVFLASPKPTDITLAAAAIADADAMLVVGGAQAIAAMAYGTESVPACDAIVGPGNRWVTAAKQLVAGIVRIDMLAGPSELVVLADEEADATTVAADLLAQAEHDPDALPILVTPSPSLIESVERELAAQLEMLPTRETAEAAMRNGYAVLVDSLGEGASVCNLLAPEHLEVLTRNANSLSSNLRHYGGLFIGEGAAEVLGDYGAGPNHTLPTGGTARSFAGLSVFNFLRVRTWMRIDALEEAQVLVRDAISLAKHEGLEAHARSASRRRIILPDET